MAKDYYHETVREALEKDGWAITDDPLVLKNNDPDWEIDFGAEKFIVAERGIEKIAVEVKSFLRSSFANEFHSAVGQYSNYRVALEELEVNRKLILAVPFQVFVIHFQRKGIMRSVKNLNIQIMVFDELNKSVMQWIQ